MQMHDNWWPHRGVKAGLFGPSAPPLEMRIFTKYAPNPAALPRDVPMYSTVSPRFAASLVAHALSLRVRRSA